MGGKMSNSGDTPAQKGSDPKCPLANSGMIYPVLDAPAAKTGEATPSASGPPKNFRTMTDAWHRQPGPTQPSRVGLDTLNASGSAQFCKGQLQAMLKSVTMPMTIVDLRQESHGFFEIGQPIAGESTIAVGWFAERDWMSVGKSLPSVEYDENFRLNSSKLDPDLKVYEIKTVTKEDGICTAQSYPVQMTGWTTEQQLATAVGAGYLRIPTTDHVRPRDDEVDQFVAFDNALPKGTWLHFHCRGGDGRTTTFLAMHDIIHNYPQVSINDILTRQYLLGGVNLTASGDSKSFKYPFAVERAAFIRDFATYVQEAQPHGFNVTWSAWVTGRVISLPPPAG
jgi:Inositol hexakisphosphate